MGSKIWLALGVVTIAGCSFKSPLTTNTSSDSLPTLNERVAFFEQYVKFRRTYESLDFHIRYRHGGDGLFPSPTEWQYLVIAKVPPAELDQWIPEGAQKEQMARLDWLQIVTSHERANNVTEWYRKGQVVVGLDRTQSVIVYWELRY